MCKKSHRKKSLLELVACGEDRVQYNWQVSTALPNKILLDTGFNADISEDFMLDVLVGN